MPAASAIVARLQCVALGEVSCTVFAITLRRVSRGNGGTRDGRVLSRLSPSTAARQCGPQNDMVPRGRGRCVKIAQRQEKHFGRADNQGRDIVGLDPQAVTPWVEGFQG
jgi:hypothetical protein